MSLLVYTVDGMGCIYGDYIAVDNACVSIQSFRSDGVRNNSMVRIDININLGLDKPCSI